MRSYPYTPIIAGVFFFFIFIFTKNAWVAEDAYINFRSIEQLYAGNGPTWNPHERVQVFTSPLWYGLLATGRLFSHNLYEISLVLSAALTSLLTWMLYLISRRQVFSWALTSGLLLASSAFFDFTSSGLENPLAYLLIALFVYFYQCLFLEHSSTKNLKLLLTISGLLVLCRLDLLTLILPPMMYALITFRRAFSLREWVQSAFICLLPVLLWYSFAFFYYGNIFPNTAYAKLNTGIDKFTLMTQGVEYFLHTASYDLITILVLAAGLLIGLANKGYIRFLSLGILLNLLYVINVGGDFMQGRFLSFAYMTAVIVIGGYFNQPAIRRIVLLASVGIYSVMYSHTPINSPFDYSDGTIHENGIADERGYYFSYTRLASYLEVRDGTHCFIDMDWGERALQPDQSIAVMRNIGYFGLCEATLQQIIVDPLAISDPFLARLPVDPNISWRIGHFERAIPEGYIESIASGTNQLTDPEMHELFDIIKLKTQSPELLSRDRIVSLFGF
ncbi:MAG: hypothetical protein V4751_03670 [Pseudomonadota bacterium]